MMMISFSICQRDGIMNDGPISLRRVINAVVFLLVGAKIIILGNDFCFCFVSSVFFANNS